MLRKILFLGIGGFIGSNLRYWITLLARMIPGSDFPYGTLIVNCAGSFILGFLAFTGLEAVRLDSNLRLFLAAGFTGALTTFSTFSVETFMYMEKTNYKMALLNVLLNLSLGILTASGGYFLAKNI